jgi:hypothetical protein
MELTEREKELLVKIVGYVMSNCDDFNDAMVFEDYDENVKPKSDYTSEKEVRALYEKVSGVPFD